MASRGLTASTQLLEQRHVAGLPGLRFLPHERHPRQQRMPHQVPERLEPDEPGANGRVPVPAGPPPGDRGRSRGPAGPQVHHVGHARTPAAWPPPVHGVLIANCGGVLWCRTWSMAATMTWADPSMAWATGLEGLLS